ncbi:hypothetical protein FRB91_011563 [Serendipita sp. 411]|nr:hypothetical protein FRC18_003861 [Serendipita sp. 400]KAG8857267.1 hypothetical protein FRB91_011563 [Serendipita sp. 411]
MTSKSQKKEINEEEDYDLDAFLDEPPVSNFLSGDHESISPRELTFRKTEPKESFYSFANVAAFILACCIAHFVLVTQGFMGKAGMAKADSIVAKIQEFFQKYTIELPLEA